MASVPRPGRPLTAAERHELGGQWEGAGPGVWLVVLALLPVAAAFYAVAGSAALAWLGGR